MQAIRSIYQIMGLPPCQCQSCSRCQPVVPSNFRALLWRIRARWDTARVRAAYWEYRALAGHSPYDY
jgi:hypothetical protein